MSSLLYCGFCGKSQHEVAKLIAGPSVHICNECTDLCHEIVHAKQPDPIRAEKEQWRVRHRRIEKMIESTIKHIDEVQRALYQQRAALNQELWDSLLERFDQAANHKAAEIRDFKPPATPEDPEIGFGDCE